MEHPRCFGGEKRTVAISLTPNRSQPIAEGRARSSCHKGGRVGGGFANGGRGSFDSASTK